tara:strand:+ start:988 stop:1215 length:228 start_codon:yes stop_codon:yes gene_type:complete
MKTQGKQSIGWLKRTLGPGILFASTAIGVSHLVQSTRAGANYGFSLLSFVIIAFLTILFYLDYADLFFLIENIAY